MGSEYFLRGLKVSLFCLHCDVGLLEGQFLYRGYFMEICFHCGLDLLEGPFLCREYSIKIQRVLLKAEIYENLALGSFQELTMDEGLFRFKFY